MNNILTVGNPLNFAVECVIDEQNSQEGNVFVFVNGKRFGEYRYAFDLEQFFQNTLAEISAFTFEGSVALKKISIDDFFESYKQAHSDHGERTKCLIDTIIDGYFDDPCDTDSDIIFHGGAYGFDPLMIVMLPQNNRIRLLVKDRQLESYNVNPKPEEADIEENQLFEYLEELYSLYKRAANKPITYST